MSYWTYCQVHSLPAMEGKINNYPHKSVYCKTLIFGSYLILEILAIQAKSVKVCPPVILYAELNRISDKVDLMSITDISFLYMKLYIVASH